jgi:dipeptidase D
MAVLEGLEPASVFHYFEDICAIPHGSGNTKKISDYCVAFAKEHGLRYIQDDSNNVILFQDGTPGYEEAAPVMIQGHLDMVCEKTPECTIDFEKDGLALRVEDGVISADGTTLGGDDGIAVAYALAILASEDIPHPPLEVVLTTDEEVGMLGAAAMDFSPLKARTMLNVDSEDEGYLLVSCAGGVRSVAHLPVAREKVNGRKFVLKVSGLTGGHSGVEIDKGRANANVLLGRALYEMNKTISYALVSVNGGLKDNAIPREATAELVVNEEKAAVITAFAEQYHDIFANEYRIPDPQLKLEAILGESGETAAMTDDSRRRVVSALLQMPRGIQRMSLDIPGLVQTSLNMGIVQTEETEVVISFALRSSLSTEKEELMSRLEDLAELLGGTVVHDGDYPAWEYNHESKLRDLMVDVFEEMYGRKPVVQALHAGVECGLFSGALPGLDCVSFGPDMDNIHTTSESMSVASVQRTWDYLKEVLKRLK